MRKINNTILIVVLLGLAGIFALSRIVRSPRLEGNLRKELVKVDTARVTEILVTPSGEGQPVRIVLEDKKWLLRQNDKSYAMDQGSARSILATLAGLQAERMVSRKEENWADFKVDDNVVGVSVYYGSELLAEFKVGKTGFAQVKADPNNPYGGFGGAYTYVRLADENEVYAVSGFLESTFNRTLTDWRDKAFLRIAKEQITKLSFTYRGDSSFVLEKKDTLLLAGGILADKTKVEAWLNQLSYKNLNGFADTFNPPASSDALLEVSGGDRAIEKVEGWKNGQEWVLRSGHQPDVLFTNSGSSVIRDLFVRSDRFTPSDEQP